MTFESLFLGVYPSLSANPSQKKTCGRLNEGTKEWRDIGIECRLVYNVARLSAEQRANMIHKEQNTGPF